MLPVIVERSQKASTMQFVAALILSLGLAASFTYFPWETISGQGFPDLDNYLATIDVDIKNGRQSFEFSEEDIVRLFMNEYLWSEALFLSGSSFEEPIYGVLSFSFLAAAAVMFSVIRRANVQYAFVLFLSPLMVDLFISQVRSAVALAIVMVALGCRSRVLRHVLLVSAFLVHTFAAILFLICKFNDFVLSANRISERAKLWCSLLLGLLLSSILAFFTTDILSLIDDRRASQDGLEPSSMAFALWWIVLTFIITSFSRINLRPGDGNYVMLAIVLMSMFVFSTMLGVGGLRFLALSLPLSFIAISVIRDSDVRAGAAAGTFLFNMAHGLYWIS